jgi:hypothetical protein
MSTIQHGYLTPPPRTVSWPATGNVSGVAYSGAKNAYSRVSKFNPATAAIQVLGERAWNAQHIGVGYPMGGKRTRNRRSKSRKNYRRRRN